MKASPRIDGRRLGLLAGSFGLAALALLAGCPDAVAQCSQARPILTKANCGVA